MSSVNYHTVNDILGSNSVSKTILKTFKHRHILVKIIMTCHVAQNVQEITNDSLNIQSLNYGAPIKITI